MNQEQVKSVLRWLATFLSPFLIAHGWSTESIIEPLSGVIVALIPLVISLTVHTQKNAIAVVDTIAKQPDSPIKAIIAHSTEAGKKIADSLPGNTTVVAGTPAAARAVQ